MRKCNMRWFSPQRMKKHLAFALAVSLIAMVPVSAFAQVLKISMTKTNVSIESVLRELEKQSEYTFFYNDNQVKLNKKVSINVSDAPIETVLNEVFKNSGYTYKIVDNQIVVSATKEATKDVQTTQQQKQRKVSGVVKDAMGEAIIGASVVEKGAPSNGTITDINGQFSLTVGGNELQITYIGYMPETVSLKPGVTSYNVTMKEDTKTLDEVVVVGYGVQKKANLTGAVSSINAEALESRSVSSVSAAMAGTMPGVTAIQSSGAPGLQTGTITVRGKNSVNAANPLVIVDGVPGSMNTIDPQDIESLTVLKDAASAAIYGVQAANGVILITTKKGKKGQDAKVSYSGSVAWATPTTKLNFLGSADYAMLYNEAVKNENPNAALPYSDEDIELFRNGTDPIGHPNTDWYKETFKNFAFEQQHNFSINGGSEKTNYSASVGYLYQGGLTNENDYNRFTGRINVESEISKWFSAGLNVSGYRGTREDGAVGFATLMSGVTRNSPTLPVYNEDGTFNYSGKANPVAELGRTGFYRQMDQQLNAILHATVHILPELSVKGLFSVRNDIRNIDYFKKHYSYGTGSNISDSGLREGYDKYYIWNEYTSQLLVNYNKTFKQHTIGALFGFEQWEQLYKYTEATRKGGGSDELTESLNTLDKSSQTNSDGGTELARRSYFGRIQYDYADKYLFEANVRYDGSYVFRNGKRWGTFPSFSVGWNLYNESFWENIEPYVNTLKVRASWGQLGNQNISPYSDLELIPISADKLNWIFNYGSTRPVGYTSGPNLVNRNLTWETATTTNVGMDLSFLNNRLSATVDWFERRTIDMVGPSQAMPGVLGTGVPKENNSTLRTRGWEISLNWKHALENGLSYNLGISLYDYKSVVTKYFNPTGTLSTWYEGAEVGDIWGYTVNDLFRSQEDLDSYLSKVDMTHIAANWNTGDLKYEDIEECYNLNKIIFNEEYGLDDVKDLYLKLYKNKNMYRFLVAKVKGKIVGYTSVTIAYNLFDGKRPFMTLWWVGTHPEYRHRGIATKLFQKIEAIAVENNCELIYFTSKSDNIGAHTFYKSLGYDMNVEKAFMKEFL